MCNCLSDTTHPRQLCKELSSCLKDQLRSPPPFGNAQLVSGIRSLHCHTGLLGTACLMIFHSELVLEKAYLGVQHRTLKRAQEGYRRKNRKGKVRGFFSGDREVSPSQAMTNTPIKALRELLIQLI